MSTYPGAYQGVTTGVPADSTGTYPNLVGYTPMETGRRIVVALADSAIGLVLAVPYVVSTMSALSSTSSSSAPRSNPASIVFLVLYLGWAVAQLWAVFAKSSRLSGVFLGATYVDVSTGRPSGGKAFGKWLLTGLISGISFGIAPLIMYFATIQEPLKRNWFDRALGLMLVDTRSGRPIGAPLPAAPTYTPPPAVAAVQFPMSVGETPARPYSPPAPWVPPAASTGSQPAPLPSPATPQPPAVVPIVEAGGLITSTPRSAGVPTSAPAEAPVSFAPQVVVREMRSVDAAEADRTTLATDALFAPIAAPGAHLRLDDGSLVALTPPTVLGRNPVAPGSHPDAVPLVVSDGLTSKTHLLVGRDDAGPWVIDLHSTNGVSVSKVPGTAPVRIEAGRKVHLPAGAVLAFGGRTLTAD